ncbi:AfsR/SARP family transcriptional regulator [Kitasatospora sp. NA04385]|nr:AfsR/SARP family transcriptional regulator [Kitasatospora sp. NA04385]
MRIGVLGPLEVRGVEVAGARLRGLLVRLVVDAGRVVPAERLVADLWGEQPPAVPGNALQTLVSRLRALGGRDVVVAGAGGYRLGAGAGEVDAGEFERLAAVARGLAAPAERVVVLRRALALWRGPALAEFADAGFADLAARRWEELRLTAVEERVAAELVLGQGAELVGELEELVAAHPLRERLHGQLMRALAAAGRPAAALERYEETRRTLAERLGVDPSPELSALHLALLRGEFTAEPRSGPAPRRSNLPLALTSFVGRERECATVRELLGATRLVTLTGPGGAGKTRLAAEVAAGLAADFPDGVWLVRWRRSPRPPRCRRRCCRRSASRTRCGWASRSSRSPPRSSGSHRRWSSVGCCWCWTTASTCWTRRPRWRPACSRGPRTSGCWPPAGSRWASPASRSARCPRCRCRRPTTPRRPPGTRRCGCSRTGPPRSARASGSTRGTRRWWWASAGRWTASRWRSSWRRPAPVP